MRTIMALVLCVGLGSAVFGEETRYTLARNGATDWHILTPEHCKGAELRAALELQKYLKEISGAELPITEVTHLNCMPEYDHEILLGWEYAVGASARVQALLKKYNVNINFRELGQDGYIIRTIGPHLLITGGRPRGTLYGVYSFLDDFLGCRWYDTTVSVIPKRSTIEFGPIDVKYIPPVRYRDIAFGGIYCDDPDLAARNKVNGDSMPLDVQHGGQFGWAQPACHTFNFLVPPDKYLAEHPEYYALRDGKRTSAQLCLTNPDVLRITIERVKQWMKDTPGKQMFDVSQNDNGSYCQCPACAALDEQYGGQSGSLLTFVNAVADAVKADFPDKYVATFAYAYSERAPEGLKPRDNVVIRLCTFCCASIFNYERECYDCIDYFKMKKGEERPKPSFGDGARKWAKLTKNIVVWDYAGGLCHVLLPCPNLQMLKPNIKFLTDTGMIGFYPQGAFRGRGGELNVLRSYLLAKLAWNPDFDVEKGIDEFLAAYYEDAAEPIRQYIDLMQANVPQHDDEMRPFDEPFQTNWFHCSPTRWWLKPELVEQYGKLFDKAEKLAAKKPNVLRRVRTARLGVQYVQIRTMQADDPRRAEIIDKFFKAVKDEGIVDMGHAILPKFDGCSEILKIYNHPTPGDFMKFLENGGR